MKKKRAILVVDVGNTSVCLAIYRLGKTKYFHRLDPAHETEAHLRSQLKEIVDGFELDGSVLCSVVPKKNRMWSRLLKEITGAKPLRVGPELELGIPVNYPNPETIGEDRLANACGAASLFGTPVVVADFGTALTFDVVSRTKGYIGGIIAPGLPLMFSYLADKTALLPEVEPAPVRRAVGKSTKEAMQIGARFGYRGMAREIIENLKRELGDDTTLCATGGYSAWVLKGLDIPVKHVNDLTLYGLGKIYEMNRKNGVVE